MTMSNPDLGDQLGHVLASLEKATPQVLELATRAMRFDAVVVGGTELLVLVFCVSAALRLWRWRQRDAARKVHEQASAELGTAEAAAIRSQADPKVVEQVLRRADEIGAQANAARVASKLRVVIESPFGRNVDGSKCTPAEYARNGRYLDRCIRHSLGLGEAPYASHGFFPKEGRLDDTNIEQRAQGIEAGLAWGEAAELIAVYADHGVTEGMMEGIARHRERGINFTYRYIGDEPE